MYNGFDKYIISFVEYDQLIRTEKKLKEMLLKAHAVLEVQEQKIMELETQLGKSSRDIAVAIR